MITDRISASMFARAGVRSNAALGKHIIVMSPPPQPGVNTYATTTRQMSPPRMLKYGKISIFTRQCDKDGMGCLVSFKVKCVFLREPRKCLDYSFLWMISDHFDSGLYQEEKLSSSWHFSIKIWICKNSQNSRELGFACTRESLKIMILPLIPQFLLVMAINLGSDSVFRLGSSAGYLSAIKSCL